MSRRRRRGGTSVRRERERGYKRWRHGVVHFDKAASWTSRWRMRLRRAGRWCDVVWFRIVNLVRNDDVAF